MNLKIEWKNHWAKWRTVDADGSVYEWSHEPAYVSGDWLRVDVYCYTGDMYVARIKPPADASLMIEKR